MNMIAVLIFNYFSTFKLYSYASKKLNFMQKYAYPMHIIFAIILVFFHLIYYTKTHEKNYFELIGVDRLFSQAELDKKYKNKLSKLEEDLGIVSEIQEKIEKLNIIYGVLNHAILCQLYDKYKNEGGNQERLIFNALNIGKLLQDLSEYLIIFLIFTYLTKDENLKSSRKWIAAVMTMFFTNEVNMYLSKRDHNDWFFDSYFSQFAIFDRIILIRYCMIPCLLTIRLNFALFNKTSFVKVGDQIKATLNTHQQISKNIKNQSFEYQTHLEKIEKNIKQSIEKIDNGQKFQSEKEKNKKSSCSQCYKVCLYILIGFVILVFFADKNFEVVYKMDHDDN